MRVCDYIANRLYDVGVRRVYGLMGGGAAGLNDGFIKHGELQYVCFHHEQGAGHAAIGEAKYTGQLSVVNPTTGCGGTNCATSVLDAWQDSVPILFISGNVKLSQTSYFMNTQFGDDTRFIRKYGIQEHNIIATVQSMTKYAKLVVSPDLVAYELDRAIFIATSGRPGPVWLDIPSDVQTAEMPLNSIKYTEWSIDRSHLIERDTLDFMMHNMTNAKRPIVIAGQGIRSSNTVPQFKKFVETHLVPYVSTYGARDLLPYDHPLNIGAIGIKGSRAANFAMQNSDFILSLGCSLNVSHIGYDATQFAPYAIKHVVDIDANDLFKDNIAIDGTHFIDLETFFEAVGVI